MSYGLFSFTILPHSYGKNGIILDVFSFTLPYRARFLSLMYFVSNIGLDVSVICFYHWFRCFCFNSKISVFVFPCAGRFLSPDLLPWKLTPSSKKNTLCWMKILSLIPTSKNNTHYVMMIVNQQYPKSKN